MSFASPGPVQSQLHPAGKQQANACRAVYDQELRLAQAHDMIENSLMQQFLHEVLGAKPIFD